MTFADESEGRAHGRPAASPDEGFALCGPGTPGGELLRRYWQPVAMSKHATSRPRPVKLLGEDLILFRNGAGEVGLLYPRCMHRGTNLVYGKVEQTGIRCCYHGWLFDPQGHCLEMPSETDESACQSVRQPWYPVVEKFGIIFAYLGPAAAQPAFPTFSIEEDLEPGEELVGYCNDTGANGPTSKIAGRTDYNWWQMFDNFMDPFHVVVLHNQINGVQFSANLGLRPEVRFEYTVDGVISIQRRKMADGTIHQRLSQIIMPNMNGTAGVTDEDLGRAHLGWTVPLDDHSFLQYGLARRTDLVQSRKNFEGIGMMRDDWGPAHGRPLREWSFEDHQDWQTDYVAQKGQGDISLHSEEHLVSADQGIAMARRKFRQEAARVLKGEAPVGSTADTPYRIEVLAGNALLDPDTGRCLAGFASRT